MSRGSIALCVLVPLVCASSAEAGHVLKVGSGQPFATIQSAVNAASDGDAVLVKPGTYAGFTITGKAIAVVQDGLTKPTINGQVLVTGVPAGGRAVLDGLKILATTNGAAALRTQQNAGRMRVYRCEFEGRDAPYNSGWYGGAGVSSDHDSDLVLVESTGNGGDGCEQDNFFAPGDGGSGLNASGSSFAAYACTFRGGIGGWSYDEAFNGGAGGHGLVTNSGSAAVSGCTFVGRVGGGGSWDDDDWPEFPVEYGAGGNGGDGLRESSATVQVRASQSTAGAGGPSSGGGAPNGQAGVPYKAVGGSITQLSGAMRILRGTTLAREGALMNVKINGEPGDQVYLTLTTSAPLGDVAGRRHASLNPPMFVGTIPGNGTLNHQMPMGDVVHGTDTRWLILEPVFVDTVGAAHTANELVWVVVNAGL